MNQSASQRHPSSPLLDALLPRRAFPPLCLQGYILSLFPNLTIVLIASSMLQDLIMNISKILAARIMLGLTFAPVARAKDDTPHGADAVGTMGPVAFLWPPERIWDAAHDNIAPCSTSAGPSNN